jgi:hypothetical protein
MLSQQKNLNKNKKTKEKQKNNVNKPTKNHIIEKKERISAENLSEHLYGSN